jgi:hypothetical protein
MYDGKEVIMSSEVANHNYRSHRIFTLYWLVLGVKTIFKTNKFATREHSTKEFDLAREKACNMIKCKQNS